MIRFCILLVFCALPAVAQQEVIAGLSKSRISISANFDGSEILIFGAVKREAPARDLDRLGIIVAVEGPMAPVTVRRKDRQAIIWINDAAVEIDRAPSFYAVNTSAPLPQILLETSDLRHRITIARAIRSVGAPMDVDNAAAFTEALIRLREGANLYQTNIGEVEVVEGTLFNTSVTLPANLVEGAYTARIYLTDAREVVAEFETAINVEKVGLERFLYVLAGEQPLIYGLLSLAIAIAAGWVASAVFRLI